MRRIVVGTCLAFGVAGCADLGLDSIGQSLDNVVQGLQGMTGDAGTLGQAREVKADRGRTGVAVKAGRSLGRTVPSPEEGWVERAAYFLNGEFKERGERLIMRARECGDDRYAGQVSNLWAALKIDCPAPSIEVDAATHFATVNISPIVGKSVVLPASAAALDQWRALVGSAMDHQKSLIDQLSREKAEQKWKLEQERQERERKLEQERQERERQRAEAERLKQQAVDYLSEFVVRVENLVGRDAKLLENGRFDGSLARFWQAMAVPCPKPSTTLTVREVSQKLASLVGPTVEIPADNVSYSAWRNALDLAYHREEEAVAKEEERQKTILVEIEAAQMELRLTALKAKRDLIEGGSAEAKERYQGCLSNVWRRMAVVCPEPSVVWKVCDQPTIVAEFVGHADVRLPRSDEGCSAWCAQLDKALAAEYALVVKPPVETPEDKRVNKEVAKRFDKELGSRFRRKGLSEEEIETIKKAFLKELQRIPAKDRLRAADNTIQELFRKYGVSLVY